MYPMNHALNPATLKQHLQESIPGARVEITKRHKGNIEAECTITIWIILTLIDRWVRRRVQKKPDGHLAKFCTKFFHTEEENTPTTEQWVSSGKAYTFAFEGIVSGISAFHLARVPYRQVLPRTFACTGW